MLNAMVSSQKGPTRHAYAWQILRMADRALLAGYPRMMQPDQISSKIINGWMYEVTAIFAVNNNRWAMLGFKTSVVTWMTKFKYHVVALLSIWSWHFKKKFYTVYCNLLFV